AAGLEPQIRFTTPDPLLQVHLVRTGHALAIVPGIIASEHLGGTRVLSLPGDPHRSLYTAARAGAARHPALLAFRAALLEAAQQLSALEDLPQLCACASYCQGTTPQGILTSSEMRAADVAHLGSSAVPTSRRSAHPHLPRSHRADRIR